MLGLQSAGSIIVPISALCPAIGAILSRFLYKQPLTPRMVLGIFICFAASAMIGSTGLADNAPPNLFLGLMFGFLAAFGWGLEGCVGGYATSMVDPEIGITIRQVTSGLTNLLVLVPLFAMFGGADAFTMVRTAFTDTQAMPWFAVAGFGAYFAFMLWYKGNAMCGTALGMSCNGAFSFWGPFFCWLVLGLWFGIDGYALAPTAWLAAVVMVVGIFTIAVNPVDFFKRKGWGMKRPLNFAILKYMTTVEEACPEDVLAALAAEYGSFRAYNKADMLTALLTAAANGLLEESRFDLDEAGELRLYFRAHEAGAATINAYIPN